MDTSARIAVVWQSGTPVDNLCSAVRAARPQAEVSVFRDPVAEGDALRRLRPRLLIVATDMPGDDDALRVRLLCATLPNPALVLATQHERAAAGASLARRLGGVLLMLPADTDAVGAALSSAQRAQAASEPQALLSLTRGLADEVNNPLLGALGQLRLLESELAGAETQLAKVMAATRALRRVQRTLERTEVLKRCDELRAAEAGWLAVDLGALLGELLAGSTFPALTVRGDRELLRVALRDLGIVGRDLAGDEPQPAFRLVREGADVVVRMDLVRTRVPAWQLPRTFEPYYVSRLLRGTSHGLALFAVQQIAGAHGGLARAQRRDDGGLRFELLLPAASA
jgi:signal transduction histidine kinase